MLRSKAFRDEKLTVDSAELNRVSHSTNRVSLKKNSVCYLDISAYRDCDHAYFS